MQALTRLFKDRSKKNKKNRAQFRKAERRRMILEGLEGRRLLAATPFTEDFETFTGAGFESSPAAGQLDSDDWRATGLSDGAGTFGGSHSSGDFARGASGGGVGTGGIYAFDTGSNTILGVQPGGSDFTPGALTLRIENTTGSTINNWDIGYDIWSFNDQPRANSLNFEFSTDDISYTGVGALDFTTPEAADASPAWTSVNRSTTINAPVSPGGFLYLAWEGDDVSGGGSRDEYGIDNVTVSEAGGTTFDIAPVNAVQAEGNSGTTAFTFEVTRSGDTSGSNDVTWTKVDVDTNATDFSGTLTDTLTFLAGETTKTVTINVVGDTAAELNEDFTVDLSGATGGAGIGAASATGTIQDDDTVLSNAKINEFVFNHTGPDLDEYIEIFSAPSEDLSSYSVLVLDGSAGGVIDHAFNLGVANASGYQYAGGAVLPGNTFTNGGDQTILLVQGFTGAVTDDLDTNDDGTFDSTPWTAIIDDVALYDGFSSDLFYSTTVLTPANMADGNPFDVGGASRIPNGTDTDTAADWRRNDFEGDDLPSFGTTLTTDPFEAVNTPLAANTSVEPAPALIVTESGGSTDVSESGQTDTFTIGLTTNPGSSVSVTVTPANSQIDLGAGPGVAIPLTFTNRLPQTVTVTADDDALVEAAIHTSTINISTTSSDTDYDGLAGSVTANIADNDTPAPATFLNEFVINHRGVDTDNFIEVITTPSAVLSSLTVLAIDGDGGTVGRIEQAVPLTTADANGFATITGIDFFDDISIVLVEGFTGAVNDDLDTNDDGVFDVTPWTSIRDAVSAANDGEEAFGFVQLSPSTLNDGDSFGVSGASRIPDALAATTSASEWVRNDFEGQGLPSYPFETPAQPSTAGTALNTPGAANSLISGLLVVETAGSTAVEEGGAGDSVEISLGGVTPTGNVTVTITPDAQLDLGSGAGVAITETFMASAGPISVAVNAFDDAAVEGPHSGTLSFEITASTDPNYTVGTTVPDVSVTITDNEAGTPSVVISELMYNPASVEDDAEWIEIVNTGTTTVDISGWVFDDEDTLDWGAIPGSTTLTAGQVAVIHNSDISSTDFRNEWGVPASALVIGVTWGNLSNSPTSSNEVLELLDGVGGNQIDLVNYDDAGDWPTDNGTSSIYLTDLGLDNNLGTSWALSDAAASPAQDPVPVNPTGAPFDTTDVGSPGNVPSGPVGLTVGIAGNTDGNEAGPIDGQFIVTQSGTSATDTIISYTVTGTAVAPGDFAALSGTVTIPMGQTTAQIDIAVVDDAFFEGTEDVTITLDTVTSGSATISGATASIDILDNDSATGFNVGDVIVNEIMKDPFAVADGDGEYFEVYNTTASPIDINGWTISDNDFDSHTIANGGPLTVPAMGYLVLGINSDSLTNGGVTVDYEYSGFTLANGDDEVILTDALSTEIDRVEYTDAAFPDDTGASLELLPSVLASPMPEVDNDSGLNWQSSTTLIGGGPDLGTPGAVNSAPAPEINVTDDTTPTPLTIFDGDVTPSTADGTDFGAVVIGSPVTSSFVIENQGGASLDVSTITFTGVDAADFSVSAVTLPATVAPGGTLTFDITFNPTTVGAKTATVEIANTDADEAIYDFALAGSATAALVPEITVESSFIEIVDGDTTPDVADNTQFGSSDVAVGLESESYFIVNDGTADLTITAINITGAHASDFAVDPTFVGPVVIAPGNNFEFEIDFDASATGTRSATVEIINDDADEGTYDFAIEGTGVNATAATVLINEIDAQTPGQDSDEFIELFGPAGTSLDGLSIVLYNGNGDRAYDAIDLDGQVIPADGYFVIGSASVANVDLIEFTTDGLQNGADAVALITGDASAIEFGTTTGTPASTTNLRDAIVYDDGDPDDAALLAALGETVQFSEDENGNRDTESLQRIPNGTDGDNFTAIAPTPGAVNGAGDTTAPTITDVIIAGSAWDPSFVAAIGTNGLGLSLPGPDQLVNLPYTNLDTIYIQFSEDVGTFTAADVDLTGVNTPTFSPTVTYNSTTFLATLSLGSAFTADKLEITIADTLTDLAGNMLDGEWADGQSAPSGNGTAGGTFDFRIDVLPGDFDDSDDVSVGDVIDLSTLVFTSDLRADLDGSGDVSVGDVIAGSGLVFTNLPAGSPALTAGASLFADADDSEEEENWSGLVDSVFDDLGNGLFE